MIALALLLPLLHPCPPVQDELALPVEVRDAAGDSVPGAWVGILVQDGAGSLVRVEGRTDERGRAALAAPIELWYPRQSVSLIAVDGDRGQGGIRIPLRAAARGGPFEVRVEAPVETTVQVDPARVGLEVEWTSGAIGSTYLMSLAGVPVATRAITDSDGRARFLCPPAARVRFAVTSAGGIVGEANGPVPGPLVASLPAPRAPGSLELVLAADDPAAVAGRRVHVAGADSFRRTVRTDASGRATIDSLPPGPLGVSLEVGPAGADYLPVSSRRERSRFSGPPDGEVLPGEQLALSVPLVPVARTSGTLRAPGGLEPIAGATLSIELPGSEQTVVTAADGSFTFLDPRVGGAGRSAPTLVVKDAPPAWRSDSEFRYPRRPTLLAPDPGANWNVELARKRPWEVRVVDAAGLPQPRAWVNVTWRVDGDQSTQPRTWQGLSDADGRVRAPDVPAAEIEVRGEAGTLVQEEVLVTAARDGAVLVLRDPARGAFPLRIVDPAREGIGGVVLELREDGVLVWSGRTGADGRAVATALDLEPTYSLGIDGDLVLRDSRDDLRAGADALVVVARPVDPRAGRVLDSRGAPVAGAVVRHASDRIEVVRTGADGRFALARVDRGRALVTVRAEGFRDGGTLAPPGTQEIEVRLSRVDEPPRGSSRDRILAPVPRPDLARGLRLELARPFLEAWSRRDGASDDAFVRLRLVESWAPVDAARARAVLESFALPDPLLEARFFVSLPPPAAEGDPRWEVVRSIRAEQWAALPAALARIDGDERRLAFLMHAYWRAPEGAERDALVGLAGETLAALKERAVRVRASGAPRGSGPQPADVVRVVNAWTGTLAERDLPAARAMVRGWDNFYVNPPRRWVDPVVPEDAAGLRTAREADQNLRTFAIVALWLERGEWSRAEARAMFAAALREGSLAYEVPYALALLPLVQRSDAELARELVWSLLDRARPLASPGTGLARLAFAARIAVSVSAIDAELGRRLFEAELPLMDEVLGRQIEDGYAYNFAPVADWLRLHEPARLGAWLAREVGAGRGVEAQRRGVDALALDRAEIFQSVTDFAVGLGLRRAFDPAQGGARISGLRATAEGVR